MKSPRIFSAKLAVEKEGGERETRERRSEI